ncbi:hypothetical protein [Verrucosispora sp. WMMD573]|uniref:hypothetical protein n=1 Tax=Verrucosispora sp. WMMD573 TaxID=3015149 RepID=UPI00248B3D8B|nr:hypothetical protein [Verrucosispora sp. WMMD573]WBB53789.1 hypothetical protein O7601_25020 [Verrucosispora sp. WMMD573]
MPDLTATPCHAERRRGVPRLAGRLAGAALTGMTATLLTSSPARAADGTVVAPAATVFVGLLALAATTTVAGLVLLRPLAAPGAPAARWLTGSAVAAAAAHLLRLGLGGDAPVPATLALAAAGLALLRYAGRPAVGVPLALIVAAGTGLLALPAQTVGGSLAAAGHGVAAALLLGGVATVLSADPTRRWRVTRRSAPWALAAVIAEAAAGAIRLHVDRTAPGLEEPAWGTPLRWICLAIALAGAGGLLAGLHHRWRPDRTLLPGQAIALPGVLIAVIATTTVALPASPGHPGVPLLVTLDTGGRGIPLVVVPQRPGWNLVHVGAEGVSVGLRTDRLSPVGRRPGAANGWALIHLPPGDSRLHIAYGGRTAVVRLDAGAANAGAPDVSGPDGPECVSAALGALLRGTSSPLERCPADLLTPSDREDLKTTVAFLAPRAEGAIGVVGDSSARSVAAVATVTAAAQRAGLRVVPAGTGRHPTLVVTGWAEAETAIRDAARGPSATLGTYLAPWLLTASVLRPATGQMLALRFDPRKESVSRYLTELARRFPGEPATVSGYLAWQGDRPTGPPRMYAAAAVSLPGPVAHAGHGRSGFLPGGTVTAVTGPLG